MKIAYRVINKYSWSAARASSNLDYTSNTVRKKKKIEEEKEKGRLLSERACWMHQSLPETSQNFAPLKLNREARINLTTLGTIIMLVTRVRK